MQEIKDMAQPFGRVNAVVILPIPYTETLQWIKKKHYAKRVPCIQYSFGAYRGNQLVGIVTYGQPASPWLCIGVCGEPHRGKVIELNRLVIKDNQKNIASKLISGSLKQLPGGLIIVSYADTKMNHIGYVYQATNWYYTGKTQERTDMLSESGHSRHNFGDSAKRQFRSSKHRYVIFTGNKRQKKELLKQLKYEILPYPKGDSEKYDASFEPITQTILELGKN